MTGRRGLVLLSWLALLAALVTPLPVAAASASGCRPLDTGIAARWTGRVGPGDTTCVRLGHPTGSEVVAVARLGHGRGVDLTYVDADGQVQCRRRANDFPGTRSCELTGRAPFHVVASNDRRTPFALAFARLDRNAGCAGLPNGSWGTSQGTTVRFGDGEFAACTTVPRAEWGGRVLSAFERRAGSGRGTVVVRGLDDGPCVLGARRVRSLHLCRGGTLRNTPVTVLLATTGARSRWHLVRHRLDDSTGCLTPVSTELGGPGTPGRLRHFTELDCYGIDADAADEFAIGVHGTKEGPTVRVFGESDTSVCHERSGALCRAGDRDWYQVVVLGRAGSAAAGAYELEPWRVRTADGPVEQCTASTAPVERVNGDLDAETTGVCLLAPRSAQYDLEVLEGAMPWAAQVGTSAAPYPFCRVLGGTRMECTDWGTTEQADRLLVFGRPDGVPALRFVARGEITGP